MAAAVQYYGTGRRKTSTARVFLRPGSGTLTINRRTFEAFFPTEALRTQIKTPMVLTETADKFDVLATVAGGGVSGQACAVPLQTDGSPSEAGLEPIEARVLRLLSSGVTDEQVAKVLGISRRTFFRYLEQLMARTGTATRFQLAAHASRQGWI